MGIRFDFAWRVYRMFRTLAGPGRDEHADTILI